MSDRLDIDLALDVTKLLIVLCKDSKHKNS